MAEKTRDFTRTQATWEFPGDAPADAPTCAFQTILFTDLAASTALTQRLGDALGTSSVFSPHPLDRQFRDIHTAATHVMIGPLVFEAAGHVEVGLDADFPFF